MTTAPANVNPYLRTKVMTASPEELRLMLLDGAIKFAHQARAGLLAKDHEAAYTGFDRCRAIILELMNSVRTEVNPELCQRVSSLYTFMYSELVTANLEKDASKLDRVIELLDFERQTWVMLMERLAEERAAAGSARAALTAASDSPAPPPQGERQALSLQG